MENILTSIYLKNLSYWKNQSLPNKDEKFTDPLFPPNINSLLSKNENGEFIDKKHGPQREERMKIEEIMWMRASEIFKNQKYLLFETKIEMADISQGSLGDCYFLASIASLTQYPKLIYQLFKTKSINKEGYFELIFFIDGKFQIVIIDDYLPVNKKTKKICYSKPYNNEIWLCILEKAWAKINGGYSNIIKGWMRHALQAFTSFPSQSIKHDEINIEILWEKIVVAKKYNFIITCSTRDNVEKFGLVNHHAYSLFDCVEIISNHKKIKLVKIRNIWKFKKWKGDWGDDSALWGEEEKRQTNFNNKNDGLFFMSFEDYYKNFELTEICYVLYNSYSKSYYIDEKNINNGNIFNIYLEEDGYFIISVIRKMWRFNRELLDNIIPTYLSIVGYNPSNENMNNYFFNYDAKNESHENISLTAFLKKGYYLIYSYHDLLHSTSKKEEYYIIKFDSTLKFKHKLMESDKRENNFILLKNIIMQIILNNTNYEQNKKNLLIGNEINKDGLGYKIIYNTKNKWINYNEDITELQNMFILSPCLKENKNKDFEWFIPPKSFNIILGMCINSKSLCKFTLKSKVFILEKIPKKMLEKTKTLNIKDFANELVYKENLDYDYKTISLIEAKEDINFNPNITNDKINIELNHPEIMKLLNNIPKMKNDLELYWSIIENETIKYIGQVNIYRKKEGLGCIIYKNSDYILIGNFENGKINGKGIVYNKGLNKKIFEGNYKLGKKNGIGILYFFNGDRYEGEFENDKRNGKGIYYFNTEKGEQKWEGYFIDGKMEGEGIFTNYEGKKEKVKYYKGIQVK